MTGGSVSGRTVNLALAADLAIRAVELLGDGEWHSYPEVMREMAKRIPPGVAMRRAESLRARKRRSTDPAAPAERVKARSTEALIKSGSQDYVKNVLQNRRLYEIKPNYGAGAPRAGWIDDRKIRMIELPKWAKAQYRRPTVAEYRQQAEDIERLRDQVANLRIYLIGLGHEKRANEIAPPEVE